MARVVKGEVISLSNDIDSTVASRFKRVGVVRSCQAVGRCAPLPHTIEGIRYGPLWHMISLLLTTDDAVMLRTVALRWNVGNRYGKLEQYEKFGTMIQMEDACIQCQAWASSFSEGNSPDEQGMVDVTCFRDTVMASSGNQAAEAYWYQGDNAWALGITTTALQYRVGASHQICWKCGSMGAQRAWIVTMVMRVIAVVGKAWKKRA